MNKIREILKREPAVVTGFLLTIAGELASAAQSNQTWLPFILAAVPVITGAIIRFFVTPATGGD